MWANFVSDSRARNVLRLKDFRTFENKSIAIRLDTGVDKQLTDMINCFRYPEQRMAVETPEYKTAIEKHLKIPCLHDEVVMEVMWGLKHLMNILVPNEQLELAKDDRLQMSYGLNTLLGRHGLSNVNPEIVNERIVAKAAVLFDCDSTEKGMCVFLNNIGDYLKHVYGINTHDWGLFELRTALKMICCPNEEIVDDFPQKNFSADDLSKFKHVHECDDYIPMSLCKKTYKDMVSTSVLRLETEKTLVTMVHDAEAKQTKKKSGGQPWEEPLNLLA